MTPTMYVVRKIDNKQFDSFMFNLVTECAHISEKPQIPRFIHVFIYIPSYSTHIITHKTQSPGALGFGTLSYR